MRQAYEDLQGTIPDLPALPEIMQELPRAIRRTAIWEVNAAGGTTPSIPWRDSYSHILVGGQAMDRGFTVEGLTVTYMPRGLGEANADTVQQRARFFGYKRSYLGYCRVWLEQDVRDAFAGYVEHEEHMREKLLAHAESGRPLREWKRAFFLDQALRPTRRQVLSVAYARGSHSSEWVSPDQPDEVQEVIDSNNRVISRFIGELSFTPTSGDPRRTQYQQHLAVHGVSLRSAYEQLLEELRLPDPADLFAAYGASFANFVLARQEPERYVQYLPDASERPGESPY